MSANPLPWPEPEDPPEAARKRVFVAGATGVLGRRVVARLVRSGHQVLGLSRSDENARQLTKARATLVPGDLFDADKLRHAVSGCGVVLHLATAIPTKARPRRRDWRMNDRIRREGTRALTEAALAAGAGLYVQQSVTYLYGQRHGAKVDEDTPLPEEHNPILESAADMERIVRDAAARGLPEVILRCGTFYGPDAAHTRAMIAAVKKGFFPVVGDGTARWNLVHVDDAAAAVAAVVEQGGVLAGRTLNVCDDEPVELRTLLEFLAEQMAARRPRRIPVWLAGLLLGRDAAEILVSSARCSNQRLKRATGWAPRYPSYREGMRVVLASVGSG